MSEVTLYGMAYLAFYGLSVKGLFKRCFCSPMCGPQPQAIQGYLAHKKPPRLWEHHMTLCICFARVLGGGGFL